MKAILMSIKPKWCELIFGGVKTIEVRKTAPKLKPPFKVYVYCTKERMTRVPSMYAYLHKNEPRACAEYGTIVTWGEIGDVIVNPHLASKHVSFGMHGKVIGEFVCDEKHDIQFTGTRYLINNDISLTNGIAKQSCLWFDDMFSYLGVKGGAALHITAPKLYDTPKGLSEFWTVRCTNKTGECETCEVKPACISNVTRPPQSWMYVEEIKE